MNVKDSFTTSTKWYSPNKSSVDQVHVTTVITPMGEKPPEAAPFLNTATTFQVFTIHYTQIKLLRQKVSWSRERLV